MFLSDTITVGQITFVIRVAIQILAYGGAALLGLIILGTAPRVANVDTHDVIIRIVGASTQTKQAAAWIYRRLRHHGTDPSPSKDLILILFLYISYSAMVSLSDIGFLGFYSCSVPGSNVLAFPASVASADNAVALVNLNLVNGSDPQEVQIRRCNSVAPLTFGGQTLSNCTSWQNSTYADRSFFNGLNATDSDVLMPRFLSHVNTSRSAVVDLNQFYIGPSTQRVTTTTLQNGIIVDPHDTGLTTIFGLPNLAPNTEVDLDAALAVELDVGCMTIGMYAVHNLAAGGIGIDVFQTNGTWRKYTGPDYMVDVLTNFTDQIRDYVLPFFNASTLDSFGSISRNQTSVLLSSAANVGSWRLPTANFSVTSPQLAILGNCTAALQNKLGIASPYDVFSSTSMCSFLGVGGSVGNNGISTSAFSRMICATATQVNMVAARVVRDGNSSLSVGVTRLPSDLHYLGADYWDVTPNTTFTFTPIERYTLSHNANGPTSHYITNRKTFVSDNAGSTGPGSPGNAISSLGHVAINANGDLDNEAAFAGLNLLDEGFNAIDLKPKVVTRWAGQVGSSVVLTSLGYNGWAALNSVPVVVKSTGGHPGTCYKPLYAIGFLPLLLAAAIVVAWVFSMMIGSSFFGSRVLRDGYGGMKPYLNAVYAGDPLEDVILAWENAPKPHMRVISKGAPITGDGQFGTALKFLKSGHAYQPGPA